ncbi:MAG TPA: YfbK domain-containing protein, partial [Opitutaceae bacterium]|nr:YfbK domain-containing protein [Opitutaceae bacterium]
EAPATPGVDALKYRQPEAGDQKSEVRNQKDSQELLTVKVRYTPPAGGPSRRLEFPLTDRGAAFAEASMDFKFAAAVAGFGMILRDSPHHGSATLADVEHWAAEGTGSDAGGYRHEFLDLVREAEKLGR